MPVTIHTLLDSLPDFLDPPMPGDEWEWWTNGLRGDPGTFGPLTPHTGFYRYRRRKSEPGEPCQIWFDHGQWWATVADRAVEDVGGVWRFAHANPITEELYDEVLLGGLWPDQVAAQATPAIGHNSGLPQDEIRDQIEAARLAFVTWLVEIGDITTEQHDQVAEGYRLRFLAFRKQIEDAHKVAKAPVLEQAREIDAAWITGENSVKAYAQRCQDSVAAEVQDYRVERKKRQDEVAQAEREARAAANVVGSTEPTRQAAKPASGLRKVEKAYIEDALLFAYYLCELGDDELMELMQKKALRFLKAGAKAPGARLITNYKA